MVNKVSRSLYYFPNTMPAYFWMNSRNKYSRQRNLFPQEQFSRDNVVIM
jgi:hypothetical protein